MRVIEQFNDYKDAFFYEFVLAILYILFNLATYRKKTK